ncbi:MAG: Gfo/Idh/MocA family protein [Anaerolineae bacterium]|jgi:predicted dehydrogenase
MGQVRVGVVGYGYWGPNLVRNLMELPTADLVAVADLSQERLARVRSIYPQLTVTTDYRDLVKMGLDAVVVATPPSTHYPIAKELLEQGRHVLIEKPMALCSAHAEELSELADKHDLTLMVGHTFEYNPAVRSLKQMISSGELGDIYYVDAVRVNLGLFQQGLNVLWDLAPHDVSILLYILGQEPRSVSARGRACIFRDMHDLAYVELDFPGNVLAHLHLSWLDPCKVRRLTVVGSRKMVVYDDMEPSEKIRVYDKGVEAPPYTDSYEQFRLSYRHGDVVVPSIPFSEPLKLECQHFVDCILNHCQPQSNGEVGLKVVRILELADISLRNGGTKEKVVG